VLQKTMEFQSSLGTAVLGPGIHGQTQVHNRGIGNLERILEFELVLRRQCPTAGQYRLEEPLEHMPVPCSVGV
jgi:hypothetical protein